MSRATSDPRAELRPIRQVFAIDTLYAVETSAKADRAEAPGEAKETCSKDSIAEA